MTYTEALRHFVAALRVDPHTPPPALRTGTVDEFHAWKAEMRAFDAARIELGLATPEGMQEENAAVRLAGRPWRIVEHARHP
ncbi:MAG: hypothetical protein HZA93_01900 [Verrucomicrobia bacterium]|nr:hypothetical protein [Verrucomicrobiota bacterium]